MCNLEHRLGRLSSVREPFPSHQRRTSLFGRISPRIKQEPTDATRLRIGQICLMIVPSSLGTVLYKILRALVVVVLARYCHHCQHALVAGRPGLQPSLQSGGWADQQDRCATGRGLAEIISRPLLVSQDETILEAPKRLVLSALSGAQLIPSAKARAHSTGLCSKPARAVTRAAVVPAMG